MKGARSRPRKRSCPSARLQRHRPDGGAEEDRSRRPGAKAARPARRRRRRRRRKAPPQQSPGQGRAGAQAGLRPMAMARKADPLATYNKKRDFAKTAEPAGKVAAKRGKQLDLHGPEARRDPAPLRFPAGAGRHAEELGGDPRAEPRSGRQAARGAHRGPSDVLRHLRGHDPQGRIWRRHGDAVGPRHLDPASGQGSGEDDRGRPSPLHPRRRADEGRMGDVPAEAAAARSATRTGCCRRSTTSMPAARPG